MFLWGGHAKAEMRVFKALQQAHGLPLRARIFAQVNTLSKLGCYIAPVANWAVRNPLARLMLHNFFGIHKNRKLPPLAQVPFPTWFSRRKNSRHTSRGTVVLFNDTFMNYNYPAVGIAAVELLERAGFEVVLANAKCCARPMISKGLLEKAREHALYNVELLYHYVEQGFPIVGCEPSCLLTLRDEYPGLLRDDKAKKVASNSYLIDEFLNKLHQRGELDLEWNGIAQKVLFHGHCHQKALVAPNTLLMF